MKYLLAFVFALAYSISFAEEPIMRDTSPIQSIPEWIMSNNPPCNEWEKQYTGFYSKLATDGLTCWRYRPWICTDLNLEGIDVEYLPLEWCQQ